MDMYMDCRGGVSGRAVLAALWHLGADSGLKVASLQEMLGAGGVRCRLHMREQCRHAGAGCAVEVHCDDAAMQKKWAHAAAMHQALHSMPLSQRARHRAEAVLDALAAAEAGVASLSMLVEMVGVCWALDVLGVDRVAASSLPWAAEAMAMPDAATTRLMEGKSVFISEQAGAVVTPLGAALVHVLAEDFSSGAKGWLRGVGVGYDAQCEGMGLRLLLLEREESDVASDCPTSAWLASAEHGVRREMVTMLESHVDHLSGEELGVALQELSALSEVLDVLWLPGIGKKNRPAGSLRVLCLPQHVATVERAFFAHTHSLGVRCQHMERAILPRGACTVDTAEGPLRAKRYSVAGADYVRVECDALRAAAEEQGVTPLSVARGVLRRG